MLAYEDEYKRQLDKQKKQVLSRVRLPIDKKTHNFIEVNQHPCINFSSNDYLGLYKHPDLQDSLIQAMAQHGLGSGASVWVSGYSRAHADLEAQFADWLDADKAVIFSSGYMANIGVLSALLTRKDNVLSDRLCHASILDGIVLSRATHRRYHHGDCQHLLQLASQACPDLIVTESVFSMQGSIAPIVELAQIATRFQSQLVIDDSHGIGLYGKTGNSIKEKFNLPIQSYTCLIASLGKAFNGLGAVVAGRHDIMDYILQFTRTYRYTTALPPALCQALSTSLSIIDKENWRREHLSENIKYFRAYAKEKGLSLLSQDESAIQPVLIGESDVVLTLQQHLIQAGFYVAAIRPPTVPKHSGRLRISLNALHTQDEICALIDAIVLHDTQRGYNRVNP